MRPPRIAILVFFLTASLFLLSRALTAVARTSGSAYPAGPDKSQRSVWGFMYYNTPFSLFPPNAAISLTDDNSTSFAARPAAFGPKLAQRGLSGQLWVGSGFTEDTLDNDGELGCSDLPGWDGSSLRPPSLKDAFEAMAPRVPISVARMRKSQRGDQLIDPHDRYLNAKAKRKASKPAHDDGTDSYLNMGVKAGHEAATSAHADIQSLQEAAEIEGKVVLLKRGGCGFLEKVMWAQRRGAIAVVVGDNQKGGPLIQMFAHGEEVENVTIPSVFTARTTAHLLSSLTQPGSFIEDTLDDNGHPVLKVQQGIKSNKKTKGKGKREPSSTGTSKFPKTTGGSSKGKATSPNGKQVVDTSPSSPFDSQSWVSRVFRWDRPAEDVGETRRPPSSVQSEWVVVEDWSDETDEALKDRIGKGAAVDPRLGSIRPETSGKEPGLLAKLFGHGGEKSSEADSAMAVADESDDDSYVPDNPDSDAHEGLWVTITPTSSASPFFDTLLVLVISPLVTLTVVYALLILRARIRRRRWRAPKSVVEQLPVRTYHTVAPSRSSSPRLPSPSSASPTTPLLQQQSPQRSRPRSRTTTGVMESESQLSPSSAVPTPRTVTRAGGREHEKGAGGFSAEWKKYMGRQVECVVCLEEYVDGVSRVMSLPCGHEFHVDCITPWLTTRRRTCPICKGDVVRSLAHGSSSTPRYEPYHDSDDDDDLDAGSSNSRAADPELDLEQGVVGSSESREGRRSTRQERWLGLFSGNLGGRARSQSPSPEDRDR